MKYTPALSLNSKRIGIKFSKTTLNVWLDIALLVLFVLTGVTAYIDKQLHEMLGMGMLVAVLLHIGMHWSWIKAICMRLRHLKASMHLKAGLDLGMLLIFLLLIGSGLIVMLVWAPAVAAFHALMFFVFVIVVVAHLGLNSKWISSQIKRQVPTRQARVRKQEIFNGRSVPVR